jgi:hypothetical protein
MEGFFDYRWRIAARRFPFRRRENIRQMVAPARVFIRRV